VQFAAPPGTARGAPPLEAARREWFLQGTQQPSFAMTSDAPYAQYSSDAAQKGSESSGSPAARITAPTTGTIIALDPDIPPNHQRVNFQAEGTHLQWLMDGKPFAKGSSAQWLPWPGRHVVQIADAKGQVLDVVRLEVRGAGVKDTADTHGKFNRVKPGIAP
jgi:penicillin-binding protein 1C